MADGPGSWARWVEGRLEEVRAADRWRHLRTFDAFGPTGELDGRAVTSFASNDYLGLSAHPAVVAAARDALARWGTGATASRLIVGSRPGHGALEDAIADWKGTERALVFSSGYTANVGVLATLGGPDVTVLSDELNHASIIDGCRLGRSTVRVYRHNDLDHLDRLLAETPGRRLVVTDTVFSMDGDMADLDGLADRCRHHDALLVLDEAHAVLGPHAPDVDGLALVRVGTLSKALGSLGGWVAADTPTIDLLVNQARSFIFTTALTPADAAAALAALAVLRSPEGEALVGRLRSVIERVAPGHPSPIVPIVLGDEERALAAAARLIDAGIFVPAIRPPTVAAGTSRLRIALSAAHTDPMIDALLSTLAGIGLSR